MKTRRYQGYKWQNKKQNSSLFADLGISVSNQLSHQSAGYKFFLQVEW